MSANIIDPCFGQAINETELIVPPDHNHDTWLDTFAEKTKHLPNTHFYDGCLNNISLWGVSNKLVPWERYKVKLFPILKNNVPSEDCVTFLKKQNAMIVGAQGLFLLQNLRKGFFPMNKYVLSFYEICEKRRRVPYVRHWSSNDLWSFYLGCFENRWNDSCCLVCFCDC